VRYTENVTAGACFVEVVVAEVSAFEVVVELYA